MSTPPPMITKSNNFVRCQHDSCKKPAVKILSGQPDHSEFGDRRHPCCARHLKKGAGK